MITERKSNLIHVRSDEFHGLVQCVSVTGTRVEDDGADGDVGQEGGIGVDEIEGVEHGLQPLDALLGLEGAAREIGIGRRRQMFVHGKQAAEDDVAADADQPVSVAAHRAHNARLRHRRRRRQRPHHQLLLYQEQHQSQHIHDAVNVSNTTFFFFI